MRDIATAMAQPQRLAVFGATLGMTMAPFARGTVEEGITLGPEVVVTATRDTQTRRDFPASVASIEVGHELPAGLAAVLTATPGIVVRDRQNYAQDLQISMRGFGARSTFGVRGLRLYSDGIPATMPDGQAQTSHFDLDSATRIDILRGPFSALYGNSSGGVISVVTEDGEPGAAIAGGIDAGSFGTRRENIKASGDDGGFNYTIAGSHFHTDGFREHSAATRNLANAKFRVKPDTDSTLTVVVNSIDLPQAQDPLGLTRAQFAADPRQAGTGALQFDTRKQVAQTQGGLCYRRAVNASDTLGFTAYYGSRETTQFQAIPTAAQLAASSAGGVIDLRRGYGGGDLRWTHAFTQMPLHFTLGASYDNLDESRRGFENFTGTGASQQIGIRGLLRRDEDNRVYNLDQYAQAEWEPTSRWLIVTGLRNSVVKVNSVDHFIAAGNGDDSGTTSFSSTNPIFGATYRAGPDLRFYVSYGHGFETPTLNEMSYRAAGGGLNFALKPARSRQVETGLKAVLAHDMLATAAAFDIETRDEIATLSNSGGRAVFRNVGATRRKGIELALDAPLAAGFDARIAYSALRATYVDAFLTCTATPCPSPTVPVAAGNAMPGIPNTMLNASIHWTHPQSGLFAGLDISHLGRVYVDDANSDAAPAYTVANAHVGIERQMGDWHASAFYRIDNLTDRQYAGSVIVNESNGRFFEPAPGRNMLLGTRFTYQWQ